MPDHQDAMISISAAAREIGVDQSTLAKQIRQGLVRSHDGKVRLSEVLADRAANIDLSRSKRRDGTIDKPTANANAARATAQAAAEPSDEEEDGPDGGVVLVDGVPVSYADARALKETYLAKLKKLEFEAKRGELAPLKGMLDYLDRELAVMRDRLLVVPGKMSGRHGFTREQIEFVTTHLYEAMEDISAEGAAAELQSRTVRNEDEGPDGGDEAPASAQPRRMGRTVPARGGKDQRRTG